MPTKKDQDQSSCATALKSGEGAADVSRPAGKNRSQTSEDGDWNEEILSHWSSADYWRTVCPTLTISETASLGSGGDSEYDSARSRINLDMRKHLNDDGYVLVDREMGDDCLRSKLGKAISYLEVLHGLPATFILLFDEVWQLAAESRSLLLGRCVAGSRSREAGIASSSGDMSFNFDVLAWHVDPRLGQSGFSPHRDRQPDTPLALERSFHTDGRARYVTHWIALSDATPENSCLYVIPRRFDPGYMGGDDGPSEGNGGDAGDEAGRDPLSRALSTKASYQNIRAVPRGAGQSLVFTHRIMHWGSRGDPDAPPRVRPRIAISFVYSDAGFEAPYLTGEPFAGGRRRSDPPAFSVRLLLACAQLLVYYQRFDLTTSTLRACYEYCKAHADKLHDAYKKKVFVEFVKAMKERRDGNRGGDAGDGKAAMAEGGSAKGSNEKDAANSEDEEALLEEMLDHSDQFDDDYDEMCHDIGNDRKRSRLET